MSASSSRRRNRWVAIIAALLVVVLGVSYAGYRFDWLHLRTHAATNEPIGVNVDVTGPKVLTNLEATVVAEAPPLADGESLGPMVRVEPGGVLPGPMTIRFKLNRAIDAKSTAVIIGARDKPTDPWVFQPATVSADGKYATIERTHLTDFWPSGWDVKKMLKGTGRQIVDAVFGETPKAKQPKCSKADEFKRDNYVVQIDGSKNTLLSCTGVEKVDGRERRVVKVTNNLNYPLLINFPGLKLPKAPTADDVKIGLDRIAKAVTKVLAKNQTVLYPSESQTFIVGDLDKGGSARISSDYGGLAQALHRMDIAATALVFIFTKMGGKGIGVKAMDRWKFTDQLLGATDCMNAVYDLNLGSVIAKCFTLAQLKGKFGNMLGLILSPLVLGGTLYNWLDSEIRSLIDQFTKRAKQSILIGRPDEGIKFYGLWRVHGGDVTFRKNGTGVERWDTGPCNYTQMCQARADIKWKLNGKYKLTVTYTSYEERDGTGASPFDTGTASEIVGTSYTVTYVSPGFLKRSHPDPMYQFGNRALCGKGATGSNRRDCNV